MSVALVLSSASAATLTVGPGETYATISGAVAAASANDVIDVDAGVYVDDFPEINVPLTVNGIGGFAILQASGMIANGKALLITNADATIDSFEFRDASVADGNGAGIRYQGGMLTVTNSLFVANQDGILASDSVGGKILIKGSTFNDNGSGDGFTHAVYANHIDTLSVEDSVFNGTLVGHDIKSRAANTVVTNNYLDDGVTGTTSCAVDISEGGNATIIGNRIVQGPNTQNNAMICYAAEGETYLGNSLLVSDNAFSNSRPGGSVGVFNHTSDVLAQLVDNSFDNVSDPLIGPGTISMGSGEPGDPGEVAEPSAALVALCGLGLLVAARRSRLPRADKA